MVHVLLMIAVVGLVAGLLVKCVPMPAVVAQIIVAAAAIFSVLMLLDSTGLLRSLP